MRIRSPSRLALSVGALGALVVGCVLEPAPVVEEEPPPPMLGECQGYGCASTTQGSGASSETSPAPLPGAALGHAPLPGSIGYTAGVEEPRPPPAAWGTGAREGAPTIWVGPTCPATEPTNGARCDPIANSVACGYGPRTCMCTMSWSCF